MLMDEHRAHVGVTALVAIELKTPYACRTAATALVALRMLPTCRARAPDGRRELVCRTAPAIVGTAGNRLLRCSKPFTPGSTQCCNADISIMTCSSCILKAASPSTAVAEPLSNPVRSARRLNAPGMVDRAGGNGAKEGCNTANGAVAAILGSSPPEAAVLAIGRASSEELGCRARTRPRRYSWAWRYALCMARLSPICR